MIVEDKRPGIRLTLPQAGLLAFVSSLVVFTTGFFSGYQAFTAQIDQIKYDISAVNRTLNDLQSKVNSFNVDMSADRALLSGRLAGLENETKWIKESVAELRLRSLPGGVR